MSDYYTESQMQRIEQAAYDGATLEAGKEWERQRYEFDATEAKLAARIAELEAAQRWIPVSERLPEIGVRVLFYNSFITNIHKGWLSCDEWVSEIGVFYNGDKLKRITHWMPLPEPPIVYGKGDSEVQDESIL